MFIPSLGNLFNRNPTYNLTRNDTARRSTNSPFDRPTNSVTRRPTNSLSHPPNVAELPAIVEPEAYPQSESATSSPERPRPTKRDTGAFTLTESISRKDDEIPHYAVLPEGINLDGWSPQDKEELNDHVRHLLHSRREGFKRAMKGFGQYVKKRMLAYFFMINTWHGLG